MFERMTLGIRTFDPKANLGDPLFKALGHPAAAPGICDWVGKLAGMGRLAVIDPLGQFSSLAALYDVSSLKVEGRYVQKIEALWADGAPESGDAGPPPRSLLDLEHTKADAVLLAAFDDDHYRRAIAPLLPEGLPLLSFDELRLGARYLTNSRRYLDPLNFATNFALFRAGEGRRSVVRTANYWSGYGAVEPRLMLILFGGDGTRLAEWEEPLRPRQSIVLDAEQVRRRFGLPAFSGMLMIHAVGVAGHGEVKYVLDDVDEGGRDPALTHDTNSWPAQFYCGLPAPREGESIRLWLQNVHPGPIPRKALSLGLMGHEDTVAIDEEIAGFGTHCLKVETLFPDKAWPAQFELTAGHHIVRPRYEIVSATPRGGATVTFAHMNVERIDLRPDPAIAKAAPLIGKGYMLPAPILPLGKFRNLAIPTPAARGQIRLPLAIRVYGSDGTPVLERPLGVLARDALPEIDVNSLLGEANAGDEFEGHFELIYDHEHGIDVDGWLHALFRYIRVDGGQMGDSSFGAHVFNIPVTLGSEPKSYSGKAPGLSTRLFARAAPAPLETFIHLIYPSSGKWRPQSSTSIALYDANGEEIGQTSLEIPLNGSRFLTASGLFAESALQQAGPSGYMQVSDRTCRLFGYHGVIGADGQFALDHMFGF